MDNQQEKDSLLKKRNINNNKEEENNQQDTKNSNDQKKNRKKTNRKLFADKRAEYAKKQWKIILAVNILSFLPVYLHSRVPTLETDIFEAAEDKNKEMYWNSIQYYIYINIALLLVTPITTYLTFIMDQNIVNSMRQDMFNHIVYQDFEFFDQYNSGELVALFNRDIRSVKRDVTGQDIMNPIKNISKALSYLAVLIRMQKKLTGYMALLIPIYIAIDLFFRKVFYNIDSHEQRQADRRSNVQNEIIQNIMTVKSFANEKQEIKAYKQHLDDIYKRGKTRSMYLALESTLHKILQVGQPIILFWFSMQIFFNEKSDGETQQNLELLQTTKFTPAQLSTFLRYSTCLVTVYNAIKALLKQGGVKQKDVTFDKLNEILSYKSSLVDKGTEVITEDQEIDIQFKDVEFGYPDIQNEKQIVPVLKKINFKLKHGDYAAFVGLSGSGKTTIIKLIQRFYDPNSGAIKIGNNYIQDIKLQSLRSKIGFVSQGLQLFNKTLEYNITYGSENYTQDQLIECCKMAGCYDFIMDKNLFPNGFQTKIGEKGMKLSGGQMQRIGIARSLMKKPKILIFDEATSALDAEKEYEVQQNIESLVNSSKLKVTIIVIAHRLSTVVNCNNIFVLKQGQIVEQGNHQQLIQQNGVYQELIKRQITGNFQQEKLNSEENLDVQQKKELLTEQLNQAMDDEIYSQQF